MHFTCDKKLSLMMNVLKTGLWLVLMFAMMPFCKGQKVSMTTEDCMVCSRINNMYALRTAVAQSYWPEFLQSAGRVPLVYISDSASYLAYADSALYRGTYASIACNGAMRVFRYNRRLTDAPFIMQNTMDLERDTLPYYYRPIMYCSDVKETRIRVPEVTGTEEWMQLVLHEYFHGFQFSHRVLIDYLAKSLPVYADSLIKLYRQNEWLKQGLEDENALLLSAIRGNNDSAGYYIQRFITQRENRRKQFKKMHGYDIAAAEDFWEKIEGPARYVEYYAGFIYADMKPYPGNCDTLFNGYAKYRDPAIRQTEWFTSREEIMPAYFYVTGFNMCRLLDKLGVSYKKGLFDDPETSLYGYLKRAE